MFSLFENASSVLLGTTAVVAITHALLGIDHSLPFIVLGRSRQWSLGYTIVVTSLCGIGHVASSVAIGGVGAFLGVSLDSLMWVESTRGVVAATLLIGFGLAYTAWAVRKTFRNVTHSNVHAHGDGTLREKLQLHDGEHRHLHGSSANVTPWALFIVFLFGPCEPLIPLMIVDSVSCRCRDLWRFDCPDNGVDRDHWVPDVRCGSSTSIHPHNRCGYGVTCRREWCGRFVFRAMTWM